MDPREIIETFGTKNYRSIALLTLRLWQLARTQPGLSFKAAFKADRRGQRMLNDVLNEHLGIKVRSRRGAEEFLSFDPGVRAAFAARPASRTNYAHRLKRSARIAAGLLDLDVTAVTLSDGSLELTGGRTKAHFGFDPVRLTERAVYGQPTPASFADVEAFAVKNRAGHAVRRRSAGSLRPSEVILRQARDAVSRIAIPTPQQRRTLRSLRVAIDALLAQADTTRAGLRKRPAKP